MYQHIFKLMFKDKFHSFYMNWCFSKRSLSAIDDSIPVFSLDNYRGFRTLGYDSAEMKPSLAMEDRNEHIYLAKLARDMFKEKCGFDDRAVPQLWNPFMCRNKVNGWVWIQCYKNDKYGRPLVTVYRHRGDKLSINQKMIASGIVNVYNGKTKAVFK